MELNQYVRRPFLVEAIEITEDNINEVAELIGTVREKAGNKFIAVDKRVIPNINRAYVGWWLTRMGENYRCYAPLLFTNLFVDHADVIAFRFESDDEDVPAATKLDQLKTALTRVLEDAASFAVVEAAEKESEATDSGPVQGEVVAVIPSLTVVGQTSTF